MTPVILILLAMIVGFIAKELVALYPSSKYAGLLVWVVVLVFALFKAGLLAF